MKCLPPNWANAVISDLVEFAPKNDCPDNMPVGFVPLRLMGTTYRATHSFERKQWSEVKKGYTHFADGDVLLARITPCFENGKAGIAKSLPNSVGAGSTEYFVFRPDKNFLIPELLLAFFKTPDFLKDGALEMSGAVGQQRVPKSFVLESKLPLPPLCEQKRIADKLDAVLARVDACRERLDRVPGIIKRFRQAVLAAATSGALTKENVSSWDHGTLRELVVDKPRNGYSPKSVEYKTSVKSLTLTAITSGFFQDRYYKYIDEVIPESSYLWLEPDDILIQRANTLEYVGISAVFNGNRSEFIYPDLMMKCKANNKVLSKFLHYLLLSEPVRQHFRDNATGTSGNMPKINQQTVLTAPMSWPNIAVQSEIVRRAEALFAYADNLEAKYHAAREQVDRLTPALLAKAFRGELVPQDPNDESAEILLERIRATRAAQPEATRARRTKTPRKVPAPATAQPEASMPVPADEVIAEVPAALGVSAAFPPSSPTMPLDIRTLADLRKAAGLNQAAVAKAMGLNQAYISQMETGKRAISDDQRRKLAEVLGVSLEEMP